MIARQERNAHLGQNLENALFQGFLEIPLAVLHTHIGHFAAFDQGLRPASMAKNIYSSTITDISTLGCPTNIL